MHGGNDERVEQGRVTLQAIADRLSVSTATVSLALRGNAVVAQATRERVRRVAEEMGYVYNRSAAALRTDRSQIVAVGIHDVTNPYFAELLGVLDEEAGENGRSLLLGTYGESRERQQRVLRTLKEYRPDGVVFCPAGGSLAEEFGSLLTSRIPVVQIARYVDGLAFDFVGCDDAGAMGLGVDHLVALGHRRIAMIGGTEVTSSGRDRLRGYREALVRHGLPYDPALVQTGFGTRDHGMRGVAAVLQADPRPTAAVCFSDLVAFGAMLGLRHAGLEAGRDFSLVGCDDVAEAALWFPALTTLRLRPKDLGRHAAAFLHSRIANPALPPRRLVLPAELVVRASASPV
jgi:LacI family transcriptional regulator